MKKCSYCGNEYPGTEEYFVIDKRKSSGLSYHCRDCSRKLNRIASYKRRAKEQGITLEEYMTKLIKKKTAQVEDKLMIEEKLKELPAKKKSFTQLKRELVLALKQRKDEFRRQGLQDYESTILVNGRFL